MLKKYPGPSLTNEQVLTELEKIQNLGWDVYADRDDFSYLIVHDNSSFIKIKFLDKEWYIQSEIGGVTVYIKCVYSLDTFVHFLNEAAIAIGIKIELTKPVDTFRLNQTQPASNKSKFLDLINTRTVNDIFDPYFDTKSIRTLLSLNRLGLMFNNPIRCLTTAKTAKNIDKIFLSDFNKELSLTLEIKICQSIKEHRRFLVLSDKKIIIIGCSLNDIDKNEVLLETTSDEDFDFFNEEWKNAINCT